MTLVLRLSNSFSDATLPVLRRDDLLVGDNSGVRFLFDLAQKFSWASLAAPTADGQVVGDVAERANGVFNTPGSPLPTYAGGGLDFSPCTATGHNVTVPAAVCADLNASQYFLACLYMKLPSSANWNTNAALVSLMANGLTSGYASGTDLLSIGQANGGTLSFRRQTNGATIDAINATPNAAHYGNVCQIAFWRNATEQRARLKNASATVLSSALASGSSNAASIAAVQPKLGLTASFTSVGASSYATARAMRLYRGFIENLATSGRDPMTVLDADWTRVAARGAFS